MTPIRNSITVSILIFCSLMAVQIFIFLSSEPPHEFYGDEASFVEKALILKETGSFPRSGAQHSAVIGGEAWGWSDFKAPGMSLYIAPLTLGIHGPGLALLTDSQLQTIRNRLRWVQIVMAACSTALVFSFFVGRGRHNRTLACLLGLQPWAFYLVDSFAALVITNFLLALGLYAFGYVLVDAPRRRLQAVLIVSAVIFWGLLVLFRPDYFPVVIVMMTVMAVFIWVTGRPRYLVLAAAGVFLLAVGANVGYRAFMDGQLRIYGQVIYPYQGLASWNETWCNDLRTRYALQGLAKDQMVDFSKLPERAFRDVSERVAIRSLFTEISNTGYNEKIDKSFAQIAATKKNESWIRHFLLPKACQFTQIVFHTETNHALLSLLAQWEPALRRPVLGVFYIVKIVMVLLWLGAFLVFARRRLAAMHGPLDWFGLFLASVAACKYAVVFTGISITHAGPEGRLLLSGLPAIQGAAAYTLIRVGYWWQGRRVVNE